MARRGIDPARLPRLLCVMEPHGTRASGTNRRVQQQYSTPSFVSSPYFGVRKRVVGRSYWNTVGESSFLENPPFFLFCAVSDGDGETLCDGCVRLESLDSDHVLLERGLSCGRVQVLACYLCTAVCCIIIITFNAGRRPCEYFTPLAGYK